MILENTNITTCKMLKNMMTRRALYKGMVVFLSQTVQSRLIEETTQMKKVPSGAILKHRAVVQTLRVQILPNIMEESKAATLVQERHLLSRSLLILTLTIIDTFQISVSKTCRDTKASVPISVVSQDSYMKAVALIKSI